MLTIPGTLKEKSALVLTSSEWKNPVSEIQIDKEWANKAAL